MSTCFCFVEETVEEYYRDSTIVRSIHGCTIKFHLVILSSQFNMSLCFMSVCLPVCLSVCLSVCPSQMSNHSSDPEEEIWGRNMRGCRRCGLRAKHGGREQPPPPSQHLYQRLNTMHLIVSQRSLFLVEQNHWHPWRAHQECAHGWGEFVLSDSERERGLILRVIRKDTWKHGGKLNFL